MLLAVVGPLENATVADKVQLYANLNIFGSRWPLQVVSPPAFGNYMLMVAEIVVWWIIVIWNPVITTVNINMASTTNTGATANVVGDGVGGMQYFYGWGVAPILTSFVLLGILASPDYSCITIPICWIKDRYALRILRWCIRYALRILRWCTCSCSCVRLSSAKIEPSDLHETKKEVLTGRTLCPL